MKNNQNNDITRIPLYFLNGPLVSELLVKTHIKLFFKFQTHLGKLSFVPFVCLLFIFWVFTYIKVPETKGRTIEEIRHLFQQPINATYENKGVQQDGRTKYTLIPTEEAT